MHWFITSTFTVPGCLPETRIMVMVKALSSPEAERNEIASVLHSRRLTTWGWPLPTKGKPAQALITLPILVMSPEPGKL